MTKSHEANRSECRGRDCANAEIIRNQIDESKGYLHEVGNVEISGHVTCNAQRGGRVRQVLWGKTNWVTNMKEVCDATKEHTSNKRTWEAIVRTIVQNFMRNKGMTTMME